MGSRSRYPARRRYKPPEQLLHGYTARSELYIKVIDKDGKTIRYTDMSGNPITSVVCRTDLIPLHP